ncbi:MAG: class I SAM-dependent methyltransferase [Chloroflexi bacterium]|nr:class I SAM-dependent methyltransferase [Chloroflexota bacterium]
MLTRAMLAVWASVCTALLARFMRTAVDTYPTGRIPGAAASCEPSAVHAQSRLERTMPWRLAHWWLARHAVTPLRRRPSLRPPTILVLDHGPGGLAGAIAKAAARDTKIIASDGTAGMGALARTRVKETAGRFGLDARVTFVEQSSHAFPVMPGSVDLVISSGGLHNWPEPEWTLAEIRRVLTSTGRYVIADLRRDPPVALWVLARAWQDAIAPQALASLDEPSSSIRSSYTAQELEWLAARAKLPEIRLSVGPAWLILERDTAS